MSSSTICFGGHISGSAAAEKISPGGWTIGSGFLQWAQFDKQEDKNEHYYSRKSLKCWNKFYQRHKNKFFKDRHYLDKDWGHYFSDRDESDTELSATKVVLEVGCGSGSSVFPLIDRHPKLFVHACDFSPEAVNLVKSNLRFNSDNVNAFVADVAVDDLCFHINPCSVDVATLIFVLSAISPAKMPLVLRNLKKVLKPNGLVLLRDYAVGDFAQSGFGIVDMNTKCQQIENRSKQITMWRFACLTASSAMVSSTQTAGFVCGSFSKFTDDFVCGIFSGKNHWCCKDHSPVTSRKHGCLPPGQETTKNRSFNVQNFM